MTLLTLLQGASAYVVLTNSNSIKSAPAAPAGQPMGFYPVSVSPDSFYDIANKYQPFDAYPVSTLLCNLHCLPTLAT